LQLSVSASENSDFEGTDNSSGGGPAPGKQKKVESCVFDSIPVTDTGESYVLFVNNACFKLLMKIVRHGEKCF
jgi:hypothetical protein